MDSLIKTGRGGSHDRIFLIWSMKGPERSRLYDGSEGLDKVRLKCPAFSAGVALARRDAGCRGMPACVVHMTGAGSSQLQKGLRALLTNGHCQTFMQIQLHSPGGFQVHEIILDESDAVLKDWASRGAKVDLIVRPLTVLKPGEKAAWQVPWGRAAQHKRDSMPGSSGCSAHLYARRCTGRMLLCASAAV